jgi:hypothetical protein
MSIANGFTMGIGSRCRVSPLGDVPLSVSSSPVSPSATTGVCTTMAVPMATVPKLQVRVRPSAEMLDGGVTPVV